MGLRPTGPTRLVTEADLTSFVSASQDSSISEFVVVVLGATWCNGANDERLGRAVRKIESFRARSSRQNLTLTGIAVDRDAREGIGWLNRLGHFDELLAGGHWLNTGIVHFVWDDGLTRPALPQLAVIKRDIHLVDGRLRVAQQILVESAVGVVAIGALAERLPSLLAASERDQRGESSIEPVSH